MDAVRRYGTLRGESVGSTMQGQPKRTPEERRIASLIDQLHETETSLQTLVPDRADSLVDPRDGSPILLRQARQALLESHRRYHRLLTRMAAVIFELDPDGTTRFVNEAVAGVTGYRPEELVGRNWWDVLAPGPHQVLAEELWRTLQRQDVTGFELSLRSKSGDEVHLEINSANEYAADGRLRRAVCIGADVSERRRALASLRESEQRLRTILQTLPVGVWYTNPEGQIVEGNPAGEQIWAGGRYVGPQDYGEYKGWWHASGRRIEAQEWGVARAITRGETSLNEVIDIECFDGTRKTILHSSVPLRDGDRITGAVIVNEDVTERVRADEERLRLLDALRERVKELSLVQAVARLLQRRDVTDADLLRQTALLIPSGWQFPDVAAARVALDGLEFQTPNFARPSHSQRSEFVTSHGRRGEIEVIYLIPRPPVSREGPFLPEERSLLETLAEMLRLHFEAREADDAQKRAVGIQSAMIESLPGHVALLDASGRIVTANSAWAAAASAGAELVKGEAREDYLVLCQGAERIGPVAAAGIRDVLTGRRQRFELDYRCRASGKRHWCRLIATPVLQGSERGGAVVLHLDVTARRRAERALRRSEDRYRTLVEAARDAVFYISPQGAFTALNASFEEITGLPRAEWLGRRFAELLHPDDREFVMMHFHKALQGERPPVIEFRVRRHPQAWGLVECVGAPQIRNGRVVGILGIGRDITERKQMEEQLRQGQKMEAVGRLAGGVAHDFNNMLTIINGYCELLLAELPEGDRLRELVTPIHDAGQRSSRLTRQLLAVSRRQILQPQPTNLAEIVAGLGPMLQRLIGEDIELVIATDAPLWLVEVDPGHIEQILLNLAVNARDAMPGGGKLTITTRNVALESSYALAEAAFPSGPCVQILVADSGCGMDQETVSRVFEPFFTTKARDKGTGLGLATVYSIVQQSGGTIDVESEPGRGTMFRICFPRLGKNAPEADPAAGASRDSGGTETILVVEDEPIVRLLARRVLTGRGYTLLEAENGCQALEIFAEHGERIQLVLTDVIMPQMGGRELADHLRKLRPDLKVLFMSGYTGDALSDRGRLEPGTMLLPKPFTPEALASKVRAALDGVETGSPARPFGVDVP